MIALVGVVDNMGAGDVGGQATYRLDRVTLRNRALPPSRFSIRVLARKMFGQLGIALRIHNCGPCQMAQPSLPSVLKN